MILTVDIGNSNICFGLHEENGIEPLFFERLHTDHKKTALEYAADIQTIFSIHKIPMNTITGIALSSVVPVVTGSLKYVLEELLQRPVLVIQHTLDLGFDIEVEDPSTIGTDILCDFAGAKTIASAPLINFDLGTATVASYMNPKGNLGSVLICPGVRTSLNSMASQISVLPNIDIAAPKQVIGKNTIEGIQSGIVYGTAGEISGIIHKIEEATKTTCTITATGGLSASIIPFCRRKILMDPTLLMKGMFTIYKRNCS